MPSKRKDYKVDGSAVNEKAERFLVACELHLAAKVKMTESMRAKGYADLEATGFMLRQ